jgi:hypothetical protein
VVLVALARAVRRGRFRRIELWAPLVIHSEPIGGNLTVKIAIPRSGALQFTSQRLRAHNYIHDKDTANAEQPG